jgi:ribosomal protein L12E/L44/L45/RPP1/RPP2
MEPHVPLSGTALDIFLSLRLVPAVAAAPAGGADAPSVAAAAAAPLDAEDSDAREEAGGE